MACDESIPGIGGLFDIMVTVGINPSTLNVKFKNGKVCIGCCNDGDDWEPCNSRWPTTITVRISGVVPDGGYFDPSCKPGSGLGDPNGDVVLARDSGSGPYLGSINGWTVRLSGECDTESGKILIDNSAFCYDGLQVYSPSGGASGNPVFCFFARSGLIPGTIDNDHRVMNCMSVDASCWYYGGWKITQCGYGGSIAYLSATYPEE